MAFVVAEPCVGCKHTDCVVVCPTSCFREGEDMLYIHAQDCIDCGACAPECPVEAIFEDRELPEKWAHYAALNIERARSLPMITEKRS